MSQGSKSSAPSSDTALKNAPEAGLSESEYVTRQAADAKAAISRVISEIQRELGHSVDPRAWVQTHTWATLGAAAVAGFAAGASVPSKKQRTLKRLARIEAALNEKDRSPDPANGHPSPKGQSVLVQLVGQAMRMLQPVLMSAITAGVTAKTVQPEGSSNGSGGESADGAHS